MSRIGKQPIPLPGGVEVKVEARVVTVKGGKGQMSYRLPPGIDIRIEDATVHLTRGGDDRTSRAMHGLARAQVANCVRGTHQGFSKALEIQGTGYRAEEKDGGLELSLGYSHPVVFKPPEGVTVKCDSPTKIVVSGIDKAKVGQAAADIRAFRPPEPYKGKGIRYEGEQVRRKAGKSGASA